MYRRVLLNPVDDTKSFTVALEVLAPPIARILSLVVVDVTRGMTWDILAGMVPRIPEGNSLRVEVTLVNDGGTGIVYYELVETDTGTLLDAQSAEIAPSPADVNGDGIVDQADLDLAQAAWYSKPGDPNWDPRCDMPPKDDFIDVYDVAFVSAYFGKITAAQFVSPNFTMPNHDWNLTVNAGH